MAWEEDLMRRVAVRVVLALSFATVATAEEPGPLLTAVVDARAARPDVSALYCAHARALLGHDEAASLAVGLGPGG